MVYMPDLFDEQGNLRSLAEQTAHMKNIEQAETTVSKQKPSAPKQKTVVVKQNTTSKQDEEEYRTRNRPIPVAQAEAEAKVQQQALLSGNLTESNPKKREAIREGKIVNKVVIHDDGQIYYYGAWGNRQTYASIVSRNRNRMFINGQYIAKSHPFWRAGRYTMTAQELDSFNNLGFLQLTDLEKEGTIYIVTNPVFAGWVKVGMAIDAEQRLSNYHTYTPQKKGQGYRMDYMVEVEDRQKAENEIHHLLEAKYERSKEWFKASVEDTIAVIEAYLA